MNVVPTYRAIERLPDVLVARAFSFGPAEFFQASDDDPTTDEESARRALSEARVQLVLRKLDQRISELGQQVGHLYQEDLWAI